MFPCYIYSKCLCDVVVLVPSVMLYYHIHKTINQHTTMSYYTCCEDARVQRSNFPN